MTDSIDNGTKSEVYRVMADTPAVGGGIECSITTVPAGISWYLTEPPHSVSYLSGQMPYATHHNLKT